MRQVYRKMIAESLDEVLDRSHTALIIVDVQNDFCSIKGEFAKHKKDISMCESIIPGVKSLLECARDNDVFVVFLQQIAMNSGLSDSPAWIYRKLKAHTFSEYALVDTWGSQIVDELKPKETEIVIQKHRPSGFMGTKLDLILRSNGIESVAVTGVVTEGCVESTARDASFHDYYVVYVGDCMGSTNKEIHDAALKIASFRGHDIINSEYLSNIWAKESNAKTNFK